MPKHKETVREFKRLAVGYGGAAAAVVLVLFLAQWFLMHEDTGALEDVVELAKITGFSGTVEAKRATGISWLQAEKDMSFGEADKVRTGDASHCVIEFKGGTEIRIGANSLIVVSESSVELGEGTVETGSAGTDSGMKIKTAGGTEIELVKREVDIF
ncbi:hypothetical protein ACFL01_01095 [Planctomycetota bacterium]